MLLLPFKQHQIKISPLFQLSLEDVRNKVLFSKPILCMVSALAKPHQLRLEKQALGTPVMSYREVTGQYLRVCRLHTLVPGNFFFFIRKTVLHCTIAPPRVLTLFYFQNQVQWAFWTAGVATEKPASFREQCFWRGGGNPFILEHFLIAYLLYSGVWRKYREAITSDGSF